MFECGGNLIVLRNAAVKFMLAFRDFAFIMRSVEFTPSYSSEINDIQMKCFLG